MAKFWDHDWKQVRDHYLKWWKRDGLVFQVFAPADKPDESVTPPPPPTSLPQRWLDPVYRVSQAMYEISRTFHGGDGYPDIDPKIGPGSLGTFLGSEPVLADDTIWYEPCIPDPEAHPEFCFDPNDKWFKVHAALLDECMRQCDGRYVVGLPDLIENIDILSQLRDPQTLMVDMMERPRWVEQRVTQLNRVYFDAFDALASRIRQPWGGNTFTAFHLWGPGRTAKVQCDASAMFSTDMFRRFVMPALTEQCRWLDNSLYHLDGTQALHQLDALLEIDALDAIEWTPQSGIEQGGDLRWYPMYHRILDAGKSLQIIGAQADEVIPLLDELGSKGLFIMAGGCEDVQELADRAENYRK